MIMLADRMVKNHLELVLPTLKHTNTSVYYLAYSRWYYNYEIHNRCKYMAIVILLLFCQSRVLEGGASSNKVPSDG